MVRIPLALIWLTTIACSASAQSGTSFGSSSPTVGGTIPTPGSTPTIFGAEGGNEILRHRAPTGSPCLAVGGFARPHYVNPNLYDHVITVLNSCPQRITMQVCYYRTQDCIPMEIPGGERKEAILGTMPSTKYFRFEFREHF